MPGGPRTLNVQPKVDEAGDAERGRAFLNPKQQLFVEKLMSDREFSPANAAKAAGYKTPVQSANQLLKNPHIHKLLGHLIYERGVANKLDANRVLQELAAIGFFNPKRCIDPATGAVLHLKDLPDDVAICVREFKAVERVDGEGKLLGWTYEFKFHDKMEALQLLARHLGILKELAPQNTTINVFWERIQTILSNPPPPDPLEVKLNELKAKMVEDVRDEQAK
jgi:phage terminase small subunit